MLYVLLSLGAAAGLSLATHKIWSERQYLAEQYSKFWDLYAAVKTQHPFPPRAFWVSVGMVIEKGAYERQLDQSARQVARNKYEVEYQIRGVTYKMLVTPRRGPSRIDRVTDQTGDDVTDRIRPYIGPREDFHGARVTPQFFNCETMTFLQSDGSERIFAAGDKIILD